MARPCILVGIVPCHATPCHASIASLLGSWSPESLFESRSEALGVTLRLCMTRMSAESVGNALQRSKAPMLSA